MGYVEHADAWTDTAATQAASAHARAVAPNHPLPRRSASYRAIVFDLAGVLLDSERAHETAARKAVERLGLAVPEDSWRRIRGGAYESFFDHILSLPENSGRSLQPTQVVLQAYDFYHDEVRRSARLFDHAIETLEAARAAFAFVAMATSSEWRLVDTAIRHFDLAGYFDGIISGDHITQKKPAPEAFLVAAWLLGIRPGDMVVVEDSTHGIRAARLARAHVIGIATSRDQEALRKADAHHVVGDHRELVAHIDRLAKAGRVAPRSV